MRLPSEAVSLKYGTCVLNGNWECTYTFVHWLDTWPVARAMTNRVCTALATAVLYQDACNSESHSLDSKLSICMGNYTGTSCIKLASYPGALNINMHKVKLSIIIFTFPYLMRLGTRLVFNYPLLHPTCINVRVWCN